MQCFVQDHIKVASYVPKACPNLNNLRDPIVFHSWEGYFRKRTHYTRSTPLLNDITSREKVPHGSEN